MSGQTAAASIRPASDADDAALRALDDATWSPLVSPAPQRPPEHGSYALNGGATRRDHALKDVLVAVADGDVAGYVKIGSVLDLESNRHVLEVKGLAVDPRLHGSGIGRSLMEAAAGEARSRGG